MIAADDLAAMFEVLLPDLTEEAARRVLAALTEGNAPLVTREPETGLVMMRVRDCFASVFSLGEVLVTQAEVEDGGVPGHGTVMGDAPARALLAATVDACSRSGSAGCAALVQALREERTRLPAGRETEHTLAARTRVAFETMPEG